MERPYHPITILPQNPRDRLAFFILLGAFAALIVSFFNPELTITFPTGGPPDLRIYPHHYLVGHADPHIGLGPRMLSAGLNGMVAYFTNVFLYLFIASSPWLVGIYARSRPLLVLALLVALGYLALVGFSHFGRAPRMFAPPASIFAFVAVILHFTGLRLLLRDRLVLRQTWWGDP